MKNLKFDRQAFIKDIVRGIKFFGNSEFEEYDLEKVAEDAIKHIDFEEEGSLYGGANNFARQIAERLTYERENKQRFG